MLLTDLIKDLLHKRPHARALVLEALPQDVLATLEWFDRCKIKCGGGDRDQVLIMEIAAYSKLKRKMGVVDAVFVHNQHNMRRVDKDKAYKGVVQYINSQRNQVSWHVLETDAPLGIETIKPTWICGEPLEIKGPSMRLIAQEEWYEPCGQDNPPDAVFCRHCGLFRGLTYR